MTDQPRKRITIDAPSELTIHAARHLDATEGRVQPGSIVDGATRAAITQVLRYISTAHNSPTTPALPSSSAPAAAAHPIVKGRCPACRGASLFLGSGGHVTCARLDCPNPTAGDDLLHGEHGTAATKPAACDTYQPPATAEMTGLCARCGMYDYRHQASPVDTARRQCILCASVVQPGHTCDPAAQRRVYQGLVEQWTVAHGRAEQLAATLREVLDAFDVHYMKTTWTDAASTPTVQREHLAGWRAVLEQPKEQ